MELSDGPLKIEVKLSGLREYRDRLVGAREIVEASLPQLAMKAGQDTIDYARYLMRLPKTGKQRISKDGTGRIMTGSAPGEAPAVDTNVLFTGLNLAVRGFTVTVNRYEPSPYAIYLEEPGDPSKARPFMGPAHDKAADLYYANVLALLQGVI